MKKKSSATAAPTASRWKKISKRKRRRKKKPASPNRSWVSRWRPLLRRLCHPNLPLPPGVVAARRSLPQRRKRQLRKKPRRRPQKSLPRRKRQPRNRPKRKQQKSRRKKPRRRLRPKGRSAAAKADFGNLRTAAKRPRFFFFGSGTF